MIHLRYRPERFAARIPGPPSERPGPCHQARRVGIRTQGQRRAVWMQNTGAAQDRRCLPRLLRVSAVAQGRSCAPRLLYFAAVRRRDSQARHSRRRAGNAGDMQPAGRRSSSDFYGLRLKPELLTVLRHAGIDLLAYDGALCSEVASPLAEAALRIDAEPGLRALFRSVVGCDDGVASEVTGTSGGSP